MRGLSPGSASLSLPAATRPGVRGGGDGGGWGSRQLSGPCSASVPPGPERPTATAAQTGAGPSSRDARAGESKGGLCAAVRTVPAEGAGQPQARVRERPAALEAGTAPGALSVSPP